MQNVCSLDIGSNPDLSQNAILQLMNLLCDNINGPKSMSSLCLSKISLTDAIVDSMCSYIQSRYCQLKELYLTHCGITD